MEETHEYTCHYCKKKYVPTKRRGFQKYCSDSCRSGNWQLKNRNEVPSVEREVITPKETLPVKKEKSKKGNKKKKKNKAEEMSSAGVKNVVAGNVIYDASKALIKLLTTKEENKPASKGDLAEVIKHLGRFHRIENLPPNENAQKPYFDMYSKTVVYRGYIPLQNTFLN